MIKGVILTLSACFIWGLIFVLPTFLSAFSSIEVALGRYFFYGVISLIIFAVFSFKKLLQFPLKIWMKALWFALIANIIYYTAIVLAVKYSSAALTTLIAGIAPVTLAFYGNWKENACHFSQLILPSVLILFGLVIVNAEDIMSEEANLLSYTFLFGLACAFLALLSWTWFVVANSQFLKECPKMTHSEWATLLGVATLVWVILGMLILGFLVLDGAEIQKFFVMTPDLQLFLIITAVLGCLCSWVGSYLWNSGCTLMPVSLCGQMTIFETIFGLSFVYMIEERLPTTWESAGISLMLLAIVYSMNMFSKKVQALHG